MKARRLVAIFAGLALLAFDLGVSHGAPVVANFPPKTGGGGGSAVINTIGTGLDLTAGTLTNTAGFGATTNVSINNAVATPVTAWQSVIALTNTGAGTEASSWTIKLLTAGAQVTSLIVSPAQVQLPTGTSSAPSLTFQGALTTGLYRDNANTSINWTIAGSIGGLLAPGFVWAFGNAGGLKIGSGADTTLLRSANGLELTVFPGGDTIVIRNPAVSGTTGFFGMPSAAGAAGTPTHAATQTMCYVDTSGSLFKCYFGGAWHSAALL